MKLQEAAQLALDMQNAVNLSGLVHTFDQICSEALWPAAREIGEGTQWVNKHPIVMLILDKLCSLNGVYAVPTDEWQAAYSAVKNLARFGVCIDFDPYEPPEPPAALPPAALPPAAIPGIFRVCGDCGQYACDCICDIGA